MNLIVQAPLTSNDSAAKVIPGSIYWDKDFKKAYKYILVEDQALAVGDVVEFSDTSGYEVTSDRSGGASIGRVVAGVAIGTLTDAYYGWIQVYGKHTAVKTDGGVATGDPLIPHATVDGRADTATSASTVVITAGQVFGYALAADGGTTTIGTVVADIRCL